jgi:hypothetical protein
MAIGCSLFAILTAAYEVARYDSSGGEQAAKNKQRATNNLEPFRFATRNQL